MTADELRDLVISEMDLAASQRKDSYDAAIRVVVEACARVADAEYDEYSDTPSYMVAENIARAIRALAKER